MKLGRRLLYSLLPTLLLVGGAELLLRASGYTPPAQEDLQATEGFFDGAWVQRRDQHLGPAFVAAETEGMVQTSPVHVQRGMHRQRFPASSQGELRLWALGGSTTAGLPFENKERGFPERLEKALAAAAPERRWRAVNAGVPGMDSRGFAELTAEGLRLGAHALVIYAGNNEIRGTLIDECSNPLRTRLERGLDRVALLRLGRAWLRAARPRPSADVAALARDQHACMRAAIDEARQGPQAPPGDHRTDALYATTVQTFADSLHAVIRQTRRAGVPVWIAIPPVHLRHPPSLGLPHPDLPEADRRTQDARLAEARAARARGEAAAAAQAAGEAVRLDPSHAEARYLLGMALLDQDQPEQALPHLQAAVDLDWQGDRVTSELQQVVRALCAEDPLAARCVDLDAAFRAAAPQGIPGESLFVDFCHPTYELGVDTIAQGYAAPILAWSRGD